MAFLLGLFAVLLVIGAVAAAVLALFEANRWVTDYRDDDCTCPAHRAIR